MRGRFKKRGNLAQSPVFSAVGKKKIFLIYHKKQYKKKGTRNRKNPLSRALFD